MFEYIEIENLKPHLLVLIPIVIVFFVTYIKKAKNKDLVKKFSIFFERFPRIIISYVLCGAVAALLFFLLIFISLSEVFIEIVLVISGFVSSYITMIRYD